MNTVIKTALVIAILFFFQHIYGTSILIEAESFKDRGGWLLDHEFSSQLGSLCLTAQGNGKPVKNAKTSINISDRGKYHVWVRTMNSHNELESTGRFNLIINGKKLKVELGSTVGPSWQYVGEHKIRKKHVSLELKDLNGYNGRCDAVYFSTSKNDPPEENQQLSTLRNEQKLLDKVQIRKFDLVVIGKDEASYAAAISAAEKGLKVVIVNDISLSGNQYATVTSNQPIDEYGFFERIIKMIEPKHDSSGTTSLALNENRMKNISSYENIQLYLNWHIVDVVADNKVINYVVARYTKTGELVRLEAPMFADCTNDAWIGHTAGTEFAYDKGLPLQSSEKRLATNDIETIRHSYPTLYSKDIKNLFMVSNHSFNFPTGHDSVNVMNVTSQMGCVIGYAASICVNKGLLPNDIYQHHFPQLIDLVKSSDDEKVLIKQ